MQLARYSIENSLFVLWRHLDWYLKHCTPSEMGNSFVRT